MFQINVVPNLIKTLFKFKLDEEMEMRKDNIK